MILITGMLSEARHYADLSNLLSLNLSCGPNILSTLFLNTLSMCSSLNIRDHVSHPYRTAVKIIVSYIIIFRLYSAGENIKGSGLNGNKHSS
jgi:hypothetical protein